MLDNTGSPWGIAAEPETSVGEAFERSLSDADIYAMPGWIRSNRLTDPGKQPHRRHGYPVLSAAPKRLDADVQFIIRMDADFTDAEFESAKRRFMTFRGSMRRRYPDLSIRFGCRNLKWVQHPAASIPMRLSIVAPCTHYECERGLANFFDRFYEWVSDKYPSADIVCFRFEKDYRDPEWLR